jgi:polyisoprenoid-binding protein YceI
MNKARPTGVIFAVILALIFSQRALFAENRAIDVNHSMLKVRVFKSGLFSPFAHNHEIEAPISEGTADLSAPKVALRIDTRTLRVQDVDVSANDRAEIQKTMEGPTVLDSQHFPQISFQSTNVEGLSDDHWKVRGNLALHGQTNPVVVDVTLKDGHYFGSATVKQRDFGMTPVSIAGGTVRVKDEVRIEFDIALAP